MTLLKWVWAEDDRGNVSPEAIYYTLRIVIFILSFVLADGAIYELVHSPRHRRQVVILVASSYVTWTYQSHTFSNSIETLLVLWGLVLIERIVREKVGCSRGMQDDHYADHFAESSSFSFVRNSRLYYCVRCLQSDHLSCVHIDTWLAIAAPCSV